MVDGRKIIGSLSRFTYFVLDQQSVGSAFRQSNYIYNITHLASNLKINPLIVLGSF